ncbi:hypothetical protein CINS5915_03155 [Campylobacter insulaenigrae]|uniref:hypothetical protein n=1 Tax=Campylobacter insulaenigrae TaxID=260714 RepID=UPI0021522960|nr:hypothetical protein [Campylobacter insulaenigrae]MCR6575363.1 hypothetical protein [Campylobacter insulaenigrae]
MADLGFEVVEYDGSIEKCPYKHKNIIFHKKFVSGKVCDTNHITLEQIIMENNMDVDANNILQCDIENFEWEVLENTDISILDKYFSQIIFEFHGCNPEELEGVKKRIGLLKQLDKYFIPIHMHFNNHGKIFYSNGLFFSTTLEISYARKKTLNIEKYMDYKEECGNLQSLDFPVCPSNPEIPIRFNF